MANSEDQDEMQHYAAFHQSLHCLKGLKQPSRTEIHHNLENSTCDPLKYTMGSPILIVSICKGKSIGGTKGYGKMYVFASFYENDVRLASRHSCNTLAFHKECGSLFLTYL